MQNRNIPKTIPALIKAINISTDINTISSLENYLACYFVAPLIFLSAIFNYIYFCVVLRYEVRNVLMGSIILLFLSVVFIIIPYLKIKDTIITHLVSILYSVVLIFLTSRFYRFIGPSIWTLLSIELTIAITRITKTMIGYVGFTFFIIGIYVVLRLSKTPYHIGTNYYIIQALSFFILFIVAYFVHTLNTSRYKIINKQFLSEVHHKQNIECLYKEVAVTEQELREQYDILKENNKIIKQSEEKLYQLAHYDTLTELPNRKMIMDRLNLLFKVSKEKSLTFYLAFIDLDNFKTINDTMGHHIGDLFLKEASERLNGSMKEEDFLGRLGGDEFALIIERDTDYTEAFKSIS